MSAVSIHARKNWIANQVDVMKVEALTQQAGISKEVATVLAGRGISTASEALEFLHPHVSHLHDPFLLEGVEWAANRIKDAIDAGERIMIHGDYDVDGVTAASLMVRTLQLLKANVSWYIPHRQREGYDISKASVDEAISRGVDLIITVDCGTSAIEPIQYARGKGIDVIVTDHHEMKDDLAPANVVINAHRPDSKYPFKELAGVGTAFKLAEAVVRVSGFNSETFKKKFCDLVAIGTVADVVPLVGENRVLVKCGLYTIPKTSKKGLRSLIKVAKVQPESINSRTLAFVLAPRLNAAGRVDDASLAMNLLLASDQEAANEIAAALDSQNRQRRLEQERILKEAHEQIIGKGLAETSKVFVLSSPNWHPGIVGIVAGRLTDKYCRPSILIAMDEECEVGVGSARSIRVFNMFEALSKCHSMLDRFGGHAQAAGLTISNSNLEAFRRSINELADELIDEDDMFPLVEIDCEIPLSSVTLKLAREINKLEPFGHCNREPVFLTENCIIQGKRKMGRDASHMKLLLVQESGKPVDCVAWGWGEHFDEFELGSSIDVCYNIQINKFNGNETAQMVLIDARKHKG